MKNLVCGIGHTGHNTAQMDKILDFYCNKLGFKHAFSINSDNGDPWIEYIKLADDSFVEFFYSSQEQIKDGDHRYGHLCIRVNNIHAVAAYLKENNIPLLWDGPTMGKDKNWQCWIADPDGNKIEFMYVSPESSQANS